MTPTPDALELRVENDIVACRKEVRRIAQTLHFSLVDQTRLITAASELARNTLVYGGGGRMRWTILKRDARTGLQLDFEDQGPGIPDLALALTDGWTSGGGMGLGLSGSKRLVHDFAIRSVVGEGTCVTITRWT